MLKILFFRQNSDILAFSLFFSSDRSEWSQLETPNYRFDVKLIVNFYLVISYCKPDKFGEKKFIQLKVDLFS